MFEILKAGGWGMIPILICSAVGLAIILERFWTLRRSAVLPPGLGEQVRGWAHSQLLTSAHIQSLRENSPLGELLASALEVRARPRAEIKERIEDTGRHVVHKLSRYLTSLGTIALIGPLLGLLGTVFGLISMFLAVMVSGVGDPMKMAGGIGEALVCTASGLIVAIPAYILHRYFRARVQGYVIDMEEQAGWLLDELSRPHAAAVEPARSASGPAVPRTAQVAH